MKNFLNNKNYFALGIIAFCGIIFVVGIIFLYSKVKSHQELSNPQSSETEIEISFGEEKLSFEEYCKRNPVSTCFDNSQPTDFLYKEEPVAVMKAEEFSPQLLNENTSIVSLGDEFIAEIVKQNVNLTPQIQTNNEMMAKIPLLESDLIENLYEEELPDDIIETAHKLSANNIIPTKKPPYFGDKPLIAVVIDDMGVSLKRTADIISVKAPLTSSFLTYARNLNQQIINAQNAGHEIMIHIPMEAQSNVDVAPDVLTTQMTPDEIQTNLQIMLNNFSNIKGGNNHMGSKLTEDKQRMLAVMKVLKNKNMFFLDSKTSSNSKAEEAAKEVGIPYAHRHIFIDNNNEKNYILGQLAKAENVAYKYGYAIAIGHPKSQTFEALKDWLPTLKEKGLILTPLSKIVNILHPTKK